MLLLTNTVLGLLNWQLSSGPLWLPHAGVPTGKVGDSCIGQVIDYSDCHVEIESLRHSEGKGEQSGVQVSGVSLRLPGTVIKVNGKRKQPTTSRDTSGREGLSSPTRRGATTRRNDC